MIDAIALLEHAIRLDPKFTLAYCASAKANASLCFRYGSTLARRAFGDEAVKQALYLQPELPEAHLAYAYHLYGVYSDYEQARVQLAIARRGLPNDVNLIRATAWMDRRQGHWEKAIRGFKEAISLDPRNVAPLVDLGAVLGDLRRFTACEQAYDRAIDLALDQPLLKAQRALWLTLKTGDITALSSVIAALPRSTAEDPGIQSWRLSCALVNRDWQQATELIEQMKGSEDLNFSYTTGPVPVDCYFILLSRFQGEQPGENPAFAEIRKKLNQRVQASPGNARLLSNLAVADALLGRKHKAIPAGPERNKSDFAIKNTGEQQGPMVLCNYGSPHFGPLQNGKRSKKLGRDYPFISSLPSAHMNYRDCLGIFDRRQTKHICVKIWKEIPPRRNTSQRLGRPPLMCGHNLPFGERLGC